MNKSFWLATAGAAVALALAAGTTLALFSAQAPPQHDTFSAGRLCLTNVRDNGDLSTSPGPMFYINNNDPNTGHGNQGTGVWAPGDEYSRILNVTNPPGCLDAYIVSTTAVLQSGDATLATKLNVVVKAKDPATQNWVQVATGPLSTFLGGQVQMRYPGNPTTKIKLPNPSIQDLLFVIDFDKNADNTYQGKDLVVNFEIGATQMANVPASP